jgi:hypothetical protein
MNGVKETKVVQSAKNSKEFTSKRHVHPATAAGLPRWDYFKTDLWLIDGKEYQTPRNTVPKLLESFFPPSKVAEKKEPSLMYDRSKFDVDRLTGAEDGRRVLAWVHSRQIGQGIVEITLRDDTFVVSLFAGAHNKVFPFTVEEFLNALYAGKVNVELDQVAVYSDSEDDSESDDERAAK